MGHVVDEEGIHPTEEKVKAIKEAPAPTNVTQLCSFLGLVNYYNKFLPNLAANLTPLSTNINGGPGKTSSKLSFNVPKTHCSQMLFLPTTTLPSHWCWQCDASDYGVGAVMSHVVDGGKERSITYIFRTLSVAGKHYSLLEKEALAIIFAVKKFHHYLFGRHFTIESDHQPLKTLFGETWAAERIGEAQGKYKKWGPKNGLCKWSLGARPQENLRSEVHSGGS